MNKTKELNSHISALDKAIAAESGRKEGILSRMGQALNESGEKPAGDAAHIVASLADEIRGLEESSRRIAEAEERRATLQEEKKTLNVEVRNLKSRESDVLDDLGRASWEYWKTGEPSNPALRDALADLIKADEKRSSAVNDINHERTVSGNPAKNLFSKGKKALLAGKKKTATILLDRLWGRAGARVRDGLDSESLKDTPVAAPFAVVRTLVERREEILLRFDAIEEELKSLSTELADMPGKSLVRKRSVSIEKSLDDKRTALTDAFHGLGKAWLETDATPPSAGVKSCKKDWDELNSAISSLEEQKRVFEVHMEFLEAEADREKQNSRIASLEADIKERQSVLKSERKKLTALDKNLEKQKEELPPLPQAN